MDINERTLWQTKLAHLTAWDKAKYRDKIKSAGKKSVAEKWREFLAIMEFGLKIKSQPSIHEQRQKVEMLNEYYEQIQRFEAKRIGRILREF